MPNAPAQWNHQFYFNLVPFSRHSLKQAKNIFDLAKLDFLFEACQLPYSFRGFTLKKSMKDSLLYPVTSLALGGLHNFPLPQILCCWQQIVSCPPHENLDFFQNLKIPDRIHQFCISSKQLGLSENFIFKANQYPLFTEYSSFLS